MDTNRATLGGRLGGFHPGATLAEELTARGLSVAALAAALGCAVAEVESVVAGTRPVTPELAAALARTWGDEAAFWLALQAKHDRAAAADVENGP